MGQRGYTALIVSPGFTGVQRRISVAQLAAKKRKCMTEK